jgi:hypothetical protein
LSLHKVVIFIQNMMVQVSPLQLRRYWLLSTGSNINAQVKNLHQNRMFFNKFLKQDATKKPFQQHLAETASS